MQMSSVNGTKTVPNNAMTSASNGLSNSHLSKFNNLKIGEINPTTGHKVLGLKIYEYPSTIGEKIVEGSKPSTKGKIIKQEAHTYENPGHHDPKGGKNPYNSSKSVLPSNHKELWDKSVFTSDGHRWAVEYKENIKIYHKFSNDGNGNFHWSGSTFGGRTKSGEERNIAAKFIPNELK